MSNANETKKTGRVSRINVAECGRWIVATYGAQAAACIGWTASTWAANVMDCDIDSYIESFRESRGEDVSHRYGAVRSRSVDQAANSQSVIDRVRAAIEVAAANS